QESDGWLFARLLRMRRERPKSARRRRAAEQRDEFSPFDVASLQPRNGRQTNRPRRLVCGIVRLPQSGRQVLGADLNCSESSRDRAALGPWTYSIAIGEGG